MKKLILFFTLVIFSFSITYGQIEYKVAEESAMTITGTSTIHDWTSTVNEINGEFMFTDNVQAKKFPKSGSIVDHIKLMIPVKSIESPRGDTMDNKTYNALKSEENPDIIFVLGSDEIVGGFDKTTNTFKLKVTGKLTVAGLTRDIEMELEGQKKSDKILWFKGSFPIDMLEYDMVPPSAMFGQIKTGKDVVIDYELELTSK